MLQASGKPETSKIQTQEHDANSSKSEPPNRRRIPESTKPETRMPDDSNLDGDLELVSPSFSALAKSRLVCPAGPEAHYF